MGVLGLRRPRRHAPGRTLQGPTSTRTTATRNRPSFSGKTALAPADESTSGKTLTRTHSIRVGSRFGSLKSTRVEDNLVSPFDPSYSTLTEPTTSSRRAVRS